MDSTSENRDPDDIFEQTGQTAITRQRRRANPDQLLLLYAPF